MFYLKKSRQLYAYTINKEYAKRFMAERNPKCIIHTTEHLNSKEVKAFYSANTQKQLICVPYDTIGSTVELVCTYTEDYRVTEEVEQIQREVEIIERILRTWPLKKKYDKAIRRLIEIDDGEGNLVLDCLDIFIRVNKDTFYENSTIDTESYKLPFSFPQLLNEFESKR